MKRSVYLAEPVREVLRRSPAGKFSAELATVCEQHARFVQLHSPAFTKEEWTRFLAALEPMKDHGEHDLLPSLYNVAKPRDTQGFAMLKALTESQRMALLSILTRYRRGEEVIEAISI